MKTRLQIQFTILICIILSACAPGQSDVDIKATQLGVDNLYTQAAQISTSSNLGNTTELHPGWTSITILTR